MTALINELMIELRIRRLNDALALFEAAQQRAAIEELREERKEAGR
jgi:hypothetical protein